MSPSKSPKPKSPSANNVLIDAADMFDNLIKSEIYKNYKTALLKSVRSHKAIRNNISNEVLKFLELDDNKDKSIKIFSSGNKKDSYYFESNISVNKNRDLKLSYTVKYIDDEDNWETIFPEPKRNNRSFTRDQLSPTDRKELIQEEIGNVYHRMYKILPKKNGKLYIEVKGEDDNFSAIKLAEMFNKKTVETNKKFISVKPLKLEI